MNVLDWLVRFIEEMAEGVTAACSGWWMLREFNETYSLDGNDADTITTEVGGK